jgi:hypothetical protein
MGERVVLKEKEYQLQACHEGACSSEMPLFMTDDLDWGMGASLFLEGCLHLQYVVMDLDTEVLASGLKGLDYGARLVENEDEATVNLLLDFWLEGEELALTPEWLIPGGINLAIQKTWLERLKKADKLIFWFVDKAGVPLYVLRMEWDPAGLETTIKELMDFDQAMSEDLN